ncbi:kinetochore-associated Ndc80 complex subunit ndc80 [Coelomomyces lativittatus]|nr:kinetochore-associated Ndc80 complex subunit ndc80 [Coelomomyces lativittatus]KAJ1513181.1 kinetochore-associated Ndc80 complex subunit ndc80 [Coelomomyces lativittatus]KAJ1514938.1 kinetochore-associated Ndc80 complex subunit ndc80 [Coelomomyces lativittatus]
MNSVKSSSTTSSSRRASTVSSKHPIMDSRPIRDRVYMEQSQQNINEYLQSKGYPQILGPKSLISPTKKDFELIFKFLYARIDPRYEYGKKFEDDVAHIIRHSIKYPFADSISKSSLHAVGSVQTWPHILAMLDFFVELLKCADRIEEKLYMDYSSEEWDSHSTFKLQLRAFNLRKEGATDEEVENDIRALFAEQDKKIKLESKKLEAQVHNLESQAQALASRVSPLELSQQRRDELNEEKKILDERLDANAHENVLIFTSINDSENELHRLDKTLIELNSQKKELEYRLSNQEIKREEAEKLAKERANLALEISTNDARGKELAIQFWDVESLLKEESTKINNILMEFNKLASDLGLPMELSLDLRAPEPKDMVKHDHIRPQLLQLRNGWNEELKQVQQTTSTLTDQLNITTESLSEADLKIIKLERDLKIALDEYSDMKLRFEDEATSLTTQINELVQEVKASKDATTADLKIWESKVQKAQLEYDRTLQECAQAKECMAIEMRKQYSEIVDLKNHTESLLQALAAEVKELELDEIEIDETQLSQASELEVNGTQ